MPVGYRLASRLEDAAASALEVEDHLADVLPELASKLSLKIDEIEVMLNEAEDHKSDYENDEENDDESDE